MSTTPSLAGPFTPEVLEGRRVRMEPLDLDQHFDGLLAIALDPDIWRWTMNQLTSRSELSDYLDTALREQREGRSVPFATRDLVTGRLAGCTRFANIDARNRRVEIGWTWIGVPFRRSHVNTEAKYLMFRHAFERWSCVRVELKANAANERSRRAMERIGCVHEGVLRKHMLRDNGEWRDSAYYSVLDSEWPGVKVRLEEMMRRGLEPA